jgi:tight adherence protein B
VTVVVDVSLCAVVAATLTGLALWLLMAPHRPALGTDGRAWPAIALAVLGLAAALLLPNAWAAPLLVLAPASWAGRLLWRRRTDGRLAESNAERMAEVCDLIAAELSAGRPPEAALGEAATAWPVIAPVAEVCRLGGDVPGALREAALEPGASGLRLLAAAWSVAQRTGGGLGAATRRVAEAVRRDQATRRVVNGELASARATARLMAGLPIVALLMGSGAGGDPWAFLLGTPAGLGCLGAGLIAGFSGLWWIEQIAREVDP